MIPADATVTCSDSSYIFMGWAESKDASACDALKRTDLAAKNVTLSSDKKYYAVWLKSDFWLSSVHADYTEQSQFTSDTYYRTSVDIISDIKILRAGSSNASYDDTLRRWNGYYTNDVRLYAAWSGADATKNLDKLVEFRILQVGEHDGDGSVVTFMATHSLPTAKRMGTRWYNDGGWGSSSLRGEMTSYVQAGLPSGLANAAKEVRKVATSGSYGYWVEGSTTPSKFWLPSYSEIFGETSTWITSSGYYNAEGTQYAWCKTNVTNATSSNTSLQNDYKTRAGDAPAGADGSRWWLRSPCVTSCEYFGDVDNDGYPNHDYANKSRGVVPCFAF